MTWPNQRKGSEAAHTSSSSFDSTHDIESELIMVVRKWRKEKKTRGQAG